MSMRISGRYRSIYLGAMAMLLGACVAEYKLYAENEFDTPPDLSEPCSYRWSADKSWYRTADVNNFPWGDAHLRGQPGLLPFLKQISSKCATPVASTVPQARISAHTLEYIDKFKRGAGNVPVAFFAVTSVGFLPTEMSNYFAVCMEAALPDGRFRVAVAQGTMEAVTNVWGAVDGPLHRGASLRLKNKEQLLQHLTQQAWHKLWTPGQTLAAGNDCRKTLDNLAK
ncbi:MAG: hypothetical protein ACKVQK_15535 [Burkholderiales bacterium]